MKANRVRNTIFVFFLTALFSTGLVRAETPPIELKMPIDCTPGENCWLVNYVDHDRGSKGFSDYMCGNQGYDQHKGTDFVIRDLGVMRDGVQVIASVGGVVKGSRDDMDDEGIPNGDLQAIAGRECGNGILVDNGNGWETQYCHMRKGSLKVKTGDKVKVGDTLGLVGMSGKAMMPHLHLSVRHNGVVMDPFSGSKITKQSACYDPRPEQGLWSKDVALSLKYEDIAIYHSGIADKPIDIADIRGGQIPLISEMKANTDAILFWADVFHVKADDKLSVTITMPNGDVLASYKKVIDKDKARYYVFTGKKRRYALWPLGMYQAKMTIDRKEPDGSVKTFRKDYPFEIIEDAFRLE